MQPVATLNRGSCRCMGRTKYEISFFPGEHTAKKEMDTVNELKQYSLHIDGPLFRKQRELLMKIADLARQKQPYSPTPSDEVLLEGLLGLTDELADQAHDRHGIDCLLVDEDHTRCECEKPGFFCSGIPGILAHMENGRLAVD